MERIKNLNNYQKGVLMYSQCTYYVVCGRVVPLEPGISDSQCRECRAV